MSTLNVIGESLENWETAVTLAAARELVLALAETAPRGHSSALLIATDTEPPVLDNPRTRVEIIPMRKGALPLVWQSSQSARPLDGEYVHSFTPLMPLRKRVEADGSQTSVMIPHTLPWDAPEDLPKSQARQLRSFTRRAVKHADVILTPTHIAAQRLTELFGDAVTPQVLPLAAPKELIADDTASARRKELGLPDRYILTTAHTGGSGNLEWLLRALEEDPALPNLVVVNQINQFDVESWPVLNGRVISVNLERLTDLGALIDGAIALALPQKVGDCLYSVYGALAQGVPVVHGVCSGITEITLDAGVGGSEADFVAAIKTVCNDQAERDRLSVLAQDRSRSFSWRQTAWQLWEIHANI